MPIRGACCVPASVNVRYHTGDGLPIAPKPDHNMPVKRLQLDRTTGKLVESAKAALFLRGPIPLNWLSCAAVLPGKTLNVSIALWWLHGMAKGNPSS